MSDRINGGEIKRMNIYEDGEEMRKYRNVGATVFAGSSIFLFKIKKVDIFVRRKLRKYIKSKSNGPNGFKRYTINADILPDIYEESHFPRFVEIVTWGKNFGAIVCTSYISLNKATGFSLADIDAFFQEPYLLPTLNYGTSPREKKRINPTSRNSSGYRLANSAVASLASIMINRKLSSKRLFSEITFIGCENNSYVTRSFTRKERWYDGQSLTNRHINRMSELEKETKEPSSEAGFSGFTFVMSIPTETEEISFYEKYFPKIFLKVRENIDGHHPRDGVEIENKYISLPRANCQTLSSSFLYEIKKENYEEYLFAFFEALFRKVDCFLAGEKFVDIMRNKTPIAKHLENELEDYNRELKLLRNDTNKNVSTASPKDLIASWYQNTGTKEFVDNLEIISNYLLEEINQRRENKRQLLLNFIGVFAIISAVWDFVSLWINPAPDGHKIGSILIGIIFIFVLIVFR